VQKQKQNPFANEEKCKNNKKYQQIMMLKKVEERSNNCI
jgi:hypothetical protein